MATAFDLSYPYDGVDAFEQEWRDMFRAMGSGVIAGLGNELGTFGDSSGRQVKVPTGALWAAGQFGKLTAQKTLAVATNGAGQPRIDRVIVRNVFGAGIELDVLTGTPGASPVAPALTSDGTMQEFPLARVGPLASGFTTVAAGAVTDDRAFISNYGPGSWGGGDLWQAPAIGTLLTNRATGGLYLYDGAGYVQLRREHWPNSFTPGSDQDLNSGSYTAWPAGLALSVDVPSWATRARLFAKIGNTLAVTGTLNHQVNLVLGSLAADSTGQLVWNVDGVYHDIVLAGDIDCTSVAGTTQSLETVGIRGGGTGALRAGSASACFIDVEFR